MSLRAMVLPSLRSAVPDHRPPLVPSPLPWVGSAISFTRRPLSFLREAHDRMGSEIIRFTYFGKELYSLRGREGTELMFSSPNLDLKTGFVEIFGGLLPRRFLGPGDDDLYAFSRQKAVFNLGAYLDTVRRSTDEVFRELGRESEVDLFDVTSALAFRTASRFIFGEEIMSPGYFGRWQELFQQTDPLRSLGQFQLNLLNPLFWRRQDRLFAEMEALLHRLIDAREVPPPGTELSYLDVGLNGVYRKKPREHVVGHLYMMFLASFLNPSLSMGWVLCDLLRPDEAYRQYREPALAEYRASKEKHGGALPRQAYDELSLLQMCIMETLRLRISAVNIRKNLHEPLRFRGHEVPVGVVVCNSPTFAHLDPTHHPEPDRYRPDRWLGTEELERSSMTARYMPFGTFAHICPGKRFSYTWIKMVVGDFFDRFSATIVGPVPGVREGIMPVLGDRDGPCRIRLVRAPAQAR